MTPQIYKTLISLSIKKSRYLNKTLSPYSISVLFFSTSETQKSKPTITIYDYFVNQHHFSPESALKIPSSTTKYLKEPEKSDSILSFLRESGFSKTHLEIFVQRAPQILSCNLEKTIKPKIKTFRDLGFKPTDVAQIISHSPWVLKTIANNRLGPSILVLKSVLGSHASVCKVLKMSGWFLFHDLEKTMIPNIEFLKSCGICSLQIVKYVSYFPHLFTNKPEIIKDYVEKVDKMGFDRKSKMFLPAVRVVNSMSRETWDIKLKLFRELGFSEDDILSAFKRAPPVFAASKRKIREVTQFLLSTQNLDISYIVKNPTMLNYSIEGRIKPRVAVIKVLESKSLLKRKPGLATVFRLNKKQFLDKYVIPYSNELGNLYLASQR